MWGNKKQEEKKTIPKIYYELDLCLGGDGHSVCELTKHESLGYDSEIRNAIENGTPKIIKIGEHNFVVRHISSWKIKEEEEQDDSYY